MWSVTERTKKKTLKMTEHLSAWHISHRNKTTEHFMCFMLTRTGNHDNDTKFQYQY